MDSHDDGPRAAPALSWRRAPIAIALLLAPIVAAPLPPASQSPTLDDLIADYLDLRERSEAAAECEGRRDARCVETRRRTGEEYLGRLVELGALDREALPAGDRTEHDALEYRLRAGVLTLLEPSYESTLYRHTGMELSPDEIHELGLEQIERIRAQMRELVGAADDDPDALRTVLDAARSDPGLYAVDDAELREEVARITDRLDSRVPGLFARTPRTPYRVAQVESMENGFMAQYFPSDGRRPGVIGLNPDLRQVPLFMLEAVLLHEAIPGHHLQIALAREAPGIPEWRRGSLEPTAYVEGWGLYAESLGRELGLYRHPLDELGRLGLEMWRALRLVVDTGIHARGWSEDRGIELFLDNTPLHERQVRVEVRRYARNPGRAVAYKLGEIELLEAREVARRRLGDAFDYPGFHDAVLAAGPLPLDTVRERIDAWIRSREAESIGAPTAQIPRQLPSR